MRPSNLLEGALGTWYQHDVETGETGDVGQPGWLQRGDRGLAQLTLLDDGRHLLPKPLTPRWSYLGITEHGSVAVLQPQPRLTRSGSTRAASTRYDSPYVLSRLDPWKFEKPNADEVAFAFPNALGWAGVGGLDVEYDRTETGVTRKVSARFDPAEEVFATRSVNGWRLGLGGFWRTEGAATDSFTIHSGLRFIVQKEDGGDIHQALEMCYLLQDLLSTAQRAFVPIADASARTEYGADGEHIYVWHASLAAAPVGAIGDGTRRVEPPLFSLGALGGVEGLARWLLFAPRYSHLLSPVTGLMRRGTTTQSALLHELSASAERYVKAQRANRARWAAQVEKGSYGESLARHAGFGEKDLGEITRWGHFVRELNNEAKHQFKAPRSSHDYYLAAESLRLVLLAVVLNRIARNKRVARSLVDHPDIRNLLYSVRQRLQ